MHNAIKDVLQRFSLSNQTILLPVCMYFKCSEYLELNFFGIKDFRKDDPTFKCELSTLTGIAVDDTYI